MTALRSRPLAVAETLMPDLADDTARGLLSSLLVDEPPAADHEASIEQFRRRLEWKQHLRQMREVARGIAESQDAGGVETPSAEFRAVHQSGAAVYRFAGGTAQSLEARDPEGPQGVPKHE